MNVSIENIRKNLSDKGLKITPQRTSILDAVYNLDNHPTVDNIIEYIRKSHTNIATGTVYKVLETLVINKLIKKVKTDKDIMRYDAIMENHHHLYCSETDRIEDYTDSDLDSMIEEYFKQKKIVGFEIEDIKVQIMGKFKYNNKL